MAKKKTSSRLDLTSPTAASTSSPSSPLEGAGSLQIESQQTLVSVVGKKNKQKKTPSLLKSKSTLSLGPSAVSEIPGTASPTTVSTTGPNILSRDWIVNFFCLNKKGKKAKINISGGGDKSQSECCHQQHHHLCDSSCIKSLKGGPRSARDSLSPELPEDVIKELKQTLTSNHYNANNQDKPVNPGTSLNIDSRIKRSTSKSGNTSELQAKESLSTTYNFSKASQQKKRMETAADGKNSSCTNRANYPTVCNCGQPDCTLKQSAGGVEGEDNCRCSDCGGDGGGKNKHRDKYSTTSGDEHHLNRLKPMEQRNMNLNSAHLSLSSRSSDALGAKDDDDDEERRGANGNHLYTSNQVYHNQHHGKGDNQGRRGMVVNGQNDDDYFEEEDEGTTSGKRMINHGQRMVMMNRKCESSLIVTSGSGAVERRRNCLRNDDVDDLTSSPPSAPCFKRHPPHHERIAADNDDDYESSCSSKNYPSNQVSSPHHDCAGNQIMNCNGGQVGQHSCCCCSMSTDAGTGLPFVTSNYATCFPSTSLSRSKGESIEEYNEPSINRRGEVVEGRFYDLEEGGGGEEFRKRRYQHSANYSTDNDHQQQSDTKITTTTSKIGSKCKAKEKIDRKKMLSSSFSCSNLSSTNQDNQDDSAMVMSNQRRGSNQSGVSNVSRMRKKRPAPPPPTTESGHHSNLSPSKSVSALTTDKQSSVPSTTKSGGGAATGRSNSVVTLTRANADCCSTDGCTCSDCDQNRGHEIVSRHELSSCHHQVDDDVVVNLNYNQNTSIHGHGNSGESDDHMSGSFRSPSAASSSGFSSRVSSSGGTTTSSDLINITNQSTSDVRKRLQGRKAAKDAASRQSVPANYHQQVTVNYTSSLHSNQGLSKSTNALNHINNLQGKKKRKAPPPPMAIKQQFTEVKQEVSNQSRNEEESNREEEEVNLNTKSPLKVKLSKSVPSLTTRLEETPNSDKQKRDEEEQTKKRQEEEAVEEVIDDEAIDVTDIKLTMSEEEEQLMAMKMIPPSTLTSLDPVHCIVNHRNDEDDYRKDQKIVEEMVEEGKEVVQHDLNNGIESIESTDLNNQDSNLTVINCSSSVPPAPQLSVTSKNDDCNGAIDSVTDLGTVIDKSTPGADQNAAPADDSKSNDHQIDSNCEPSNKVNISTKGGDEVNLITNKTETKTEDDKTSINYPVPEGDKNDVRGNDVSGKSEDGQPSSLVHAVPMMVYFSPPNSVIDDYHSSDNQYNHRFDSLKTDSVIEDGDQSLTELNVIDHSIQPSMNTINTSITSANDQEKILISEGDTSSSSNEQLMSSMFIRESSTESEDRITYLSSSTVCKVKDNVSPKNIGLIEYNLDTKTKTTVNGQDAQDTIKDRVRPKTLANFTISSYYDKSPSKLNISDHYSSLKVSKSPTNESFPSINYTSNNINHGTSNTSNYNFQSLNHQNKKHVSLLRINNDSVGQKKEDKVPASDPVQSVPSPTAPNNPNKRFSLNEEILSLKVRPLTKPKPTLEAKVSNGSNTSSTSSCSLRDFAFCNYNSTSSASGFETFEVVKNSTSLRFEPRRSGSRSDSKSGSSSRIGSERESPSSVTSGTSFKRQQSGNLCPPPPPPPPPALFADPVTPMKETALNGHQKVAAEECRSEDKNGAKEDAHQVLNNSLTLRSRLMEEIKGFRKPPANRTVSLTSSGPSSLGPMSMPSMSGGQSMGVGSSSTVGRQASTGQPSPGQLVLPPVSLCNPLKKVSIVTTTTAFI